jgi:hypothetical protein
MQKGVAQAAPFFVLTQKTPPSFRDAPLGAGPESILTNGGYGFRARRFASPRNDEVMRGNLEHDVDRYQRRTRQRGTMPSVVRSWIKNVLAMLHAAGPHPFPFIG